jgi:hypothetical protein
VGQNKLGKNYGANLKIKWNNFLNEKQIIIPFGAKKEQIVIYLGTKITKLRTKM